MADKLTLDRHDMKDRATAHLRIYVGGITEKATIDDLYEHFISFGQINGIIINKNFGFIQFEDESSVHEAISKADGSVFQGKTLSVRTATPMDKPRQTESVTIQPAVPHAVALSEKNVPVEDDVEEYDNYGNYVGEQSYEEEDQSFNQGDRGGRGRGRGRGGPRGRGGRGGTTFRDRSPIGPMQGKDWQEPPPRSFDRYAAPLPDYHRSFQTPKPERNDCEIIVVSKALTEYAEYIEDRLKRLGIVVDLLFPLEDVPIGKVLGNIASRGCLYAILVMPQNQEHNSLTLTILHGLPQEHRNMPINDALQLLSRNYQEVQRGGPSGREAVYALLGQLADGRTLTVLQYDKVIEYLQEKREQQVKIEVGEPLTKSTSNKTQAELQQRILSILNDKKVATPEPVQEPTAVRSPAAVPPPTAAQPHKLLNDPSVRKALDSIIQKFV